MSRRARYEIDPISGRNRPAVAPQRQHSPLILPGDPGPRSAIVPTLPNGGAMTPQAAMAPPLNQIVPFLMANGAPVQLQTGATPDGKVFVALSCGVIQIPAAFSLEEVDSQLLPAIAKACEGAREALDGLARQAAELPAVPAGCEDLLAEAEAAVGPPLVAEACTDA